MVTKWGKNQFSQPTPLLAPIAAGARIMMEKVESGLDRAANDERNFLKMHSRAALFIGSRRVYTRRIPRVGGLIGISISI